MEYRKPTHHRMTRRCAAHDYSAPGIYHITIHVAEGCGMPFGQVVGNPSAPDGSPDAPHVALSPIGQMVEHELTHSIPQYYKMIEVQDHIVMPEHIHTIIEVHDPIITQSGKPSTLGQVIAGFKKGCNRRYWEIIGQGNEALRENRNGTNQDRPSPFKVPSSAATGRQPLFAPGYCDVMPLHSGQLATQRAYIKDNPRSRLLRTSNRAWLMPHRGGIDTALTPAALRGYLQRECHPTQATPEALAGIEARLLIADSPTQRLIDCDTFGNRALLTEHRCLPVVCHHKDAPRFAEQKARCLEAAAAGAVLISARIAKGEQAIIDALVHDGFPVVLILDNGFPDRYHPSADRLALCTAGRLLLITPWQYHYRPNDEPITRPACKAMNCLAQALCRTKDSWWKTLKP